MKLNQFNLIRYMESSQMSALREVFISKANAKQRQGRAGRVREGFCFRMYSSEKWVNDTISELACYTDSYFGITINTDLSKSLMVCTYACKVSNYGDFRTWHKRLSIFQKHRYKRHQKYIKFMLIAKDNNRTSNLKRKGCHSCILSKCQ